MKDDATRTTIRWRQRPRRRGRTLPLRMWLILAVAAITGAGFLSQLGLTAMMAVWNQRAEDARLTSITRIIGTDAAQWRNPAWQRRAGASLGALGVDAAIYTTPPDARGQVTMGQPVYATTDARGFLATSGPDATADQRPDQAPEFQRLVITAPIASAASLRAHPPVGIALLWFTRPPPGELPQALWPAVELGTFALTLAIVVWLVGQPVLRPLAEMSQAARDMAGGDLTIHLPPTPVREIAEVSAALEGMSGALGDALARQAALEEERRFFVGAIAHDLRTPLFMLRGYLKGLEQGVVTTPEKVAHYISMSGAKANELERLVTDLFAYTRLEYLEQEPERLPLELGALLRQSAEAAEPLAAVRGITLTVAGPDDDCPLLGDEHLLSRAVANLVENALRHTPDGGAIWVRWRQRAATLVFTVEDSGPGIAARDLPRIFTALYRGEASRNRQWGGAGLGLAIARRILRAHGGELVGGNRAEGGAIFTATLPGGHAGEPPVSDVADVATPAGAS